MSNNLQGLRNLHRHLSRKSILTTEERLQKIDLDLLYSKERLVKSLSSPLNTCPTCGQTI